MSRHTLFWMTLGSFITLCELFLFILICSGFDTFVFHKQYCLFLIPNLLYFSFQFVLNYVILLTSVDNIKKT